MKSITVEGATSLRRPLGQGLFVGWRWRRGRRRGGGRGWCGRGRGGAGRRRGAGRGGGRRRRRRGGGSWCAGGRRGRRRHAARRRGAFRFEELLPLTVQLQQRTKQLLLHRLWAQFVPPTLCSNIFRLSSHRLWAQFVPPLCSNTFRLLLHRLWGPLCVSTRSGCYFTGYGPSSSPPPLCSNTFMLLLHRLWAQFVPLLYVPTHSCYLCTGYGPCSSSSVFQHFQGKILAQHVFRSISWVDLSEAINGTLSPNPFVW